MYWLDCVSKIWSKNPIYELRNHTHLEINGQFIRLWWILLLDHDLQLLLIFSSHAWFVTSNSSTHFEFQTVAKLASFYKEILFFLLMLPIILQLLFTCLFQLIEHKRESDLDFHSYAYSIPRTSLPSHKQLPNMTDFLFLSEPINYYNDLYITLLIKQSK